MPPKYHLDRFERCIAPSGGVYCTAWADLVSDKPSQLLDTIKAYSAHDSKHYNYTNIRYGLCLTTTCDQFYGDSSQESLWNATEACLNETMTREFDLKTRVTDIDCYGHGHQFETNAVDHAILLVLAIILALNVAGSVYDIWLRDQTKPGIEFLVTFSILANWKRLVAPPSDDPVKSRLRCLNGIKAMTSLLVVLGHIPMICINTAINPNFFESLFRSITFNILHQGHVITLTFFTISGFFLAYSMEQYAEKNTLNWSIWPKAIFARWLRLTPANLVVLLITAIWYKFIPIGPLFKEYIVWEATDCRQQWLHNVLYTTNMVDNSQCNLQVWFLASDMQLHMIALAVLLLAPSKRVRNWSLLAMYLVGIGYPAYQVYTMNLDGTFISTPTAINKFYTSSATFNTVLKRTIPNIPCFVIGMSFGYIIYSMQKNNQLDANYRKYRALVWSLPLVTMSAMTVGYLFFLDGPRQPMLVRILFAPICKPIFGLNVQLLILGCVCRCEDVMRGILEWKGWLPVARVSYCTYLVHMLVVRYAGGTRDGLSHLSHTQMMIQYFGVLYMTLIFATALYLLVEAPFGELAKRCLSPPKGDERKGNDGREARDELKAD